MDHKKKSFGQRCKDMWHYFSTYEKIWFFSILVLAIVFSFIFPETDDPDYNVAIKCANTSSYEAVSANFEGSKGEFVISGFYYTPELKADGNYEDAEGVTYYDVSYLGYDEYTVLAGDKNTTSLKLPAPLKADMNIVFVGYADSDDAEIHVTLLSGGGETVFEQSGVTFNEGTFGSTTVTENPLKYFVNVKWITFLYLLDVVLNVACELLISKQSKWNFIVSLAVEVVEILVCVFCAYRFATMAVTLLFWIPCDIISFIVWNRHPDQQDEEVTVVKKLTPWQDVLIVLGIAVWTVGVGYLLTFLDVPGGIFANNVQAKNIACYLDACASAVGIVNGVLILLRYREQWIAWYICCIIETVINIMAGFCWCLKPAISQTQPMATSSGQSTSNNSNCVTRRKPQPLPQTLLHPTNRQNKQSNLKTQTNNFNNLIRRQTFLFADVVLFPAKLSSHNRQRHGINFAMSTTIN